MKRSTEQLLEDLLEETAPPDFRAALLQETLRHARRRKRVRRLGHGLGVVAIAGLAALTFWKPPGPAVVKDPTVRPGLIIVHSRPLRPDQIVSTRAGSISIMASSVSTMAIVETSASDRYYVEIDDRQLFALLAGRPAALVRQGPDESRLIFVNPNDREELVVP